MKRWIERMGQVVWGKCTWIRFENLYISGATFENEYANPWWKGVISTADNL